MTCRASSSVLGCFEDFHQVHPQLVYLGGPASSSHSADCHASSHNCASTCGGQESALVNPHTGVLEGYPDNECAAVDMGHGGDRLLAGKVRNQLLLGPRSTDVRYVIDNGVVYSPPWRGGGTSRGSGHEAHVHCSQTPWATRSDAPWCARTMTADDRRRIQAQAERAARGRHVLTVPLRPLLTDAARAKRRREIMDAQSIVGRRRTGIYGPGMARDIMAFQAIMGMRPTGIVGQGTWEQLLFVNLAHFYGF